MGLGGGSFSGLSQAGTSLFNKPFQTGTGIGPAGGASQLSIGTGLGGTTGFGGTTAGTVLGQNSGGSFGVGGMGNQNQTASL